MKLSKMIFWQAFLWDKLAKFFPIIFIVCCTFFYLLNYRDLEFYLNVGITLIGIILIVWWFWVVYTISMIAALLESNDRDLKEIITEIKEIYKEIKD